MSMIRQRTFTVMHPRGLGDNTATGPQQGDAGTQYGTQLYNNLLAQIDDLTSGIAYRDDLLAQGSAVAGNSFQGWLAQNQNLLMWGGLGLFALVILPKVLGGHR